MDIVPLIDDSDDPEWSDPFMYESSDFTVYPPGNGDFCNVYGIIPYVNSGLTRTMRSVGISVSRENLREWLTH